MHLFRNSEQVFLRFTTNSMHPSGAISREEALHEATSEGHKVNEFLQHRDALQRQRAMDIKKIGSLTGNLIQPSSRLKIGPDPSPKQMMSLEVGNDWPSLTKDFGVNYNIDSPNLSAKSFTIDYEKEKPNYFSSLDPKADHFWTLGADIGIFQESLRNMKSIEDDIYSDKFNPHPRTRLGIKEKIDFNMARAVARNESRLRFQYYFNQATDSLGTYLRINFVYKHEIDGGKPSMDQYLMFTFPTSDQEREAYRHVFWGAPYPEAGFNVTPESRWLEDYHAKNKSSAPGMDELAHRFSYLNSQISRPPEYAAK